MCCISVPHAICGCDPPKYHHINHHQRAFSFIEPQHRSHARNRDEWHVLPRRYKEATDSAVRSFHTLEVAVKLEAVASVEVLVALQGAASAEQITHVLAANQSEQLRFAAAYLPLLALDRERAYDVLIPDVSAGPNVVLNGSTTSTVRVFITFHVRWERSGCTVRNGASIMQHFKPVGSRCCSVCSIP
jgi:hypothetical protein